MNHLNEEMVKARAQEIRENLGKVRRYTSLSDDEFWADERNLYTIMHLLLMSTEATAALCSHILARLARRAPASYAECFEGLRGLDVVDDELDGGLLTYITTHGIPDGRCCALQRWVRGRLLPGNGRPEHYRAQGRLMARMDSFTQQWQQSLPPGNTKRHYDWDGLFMNDPEVGLPPGESWAYLPADWVEPFRAVVRQFRELIGAWGTGSEVYGLIHADMGLDANLLFWRGQPRPIDFDGSGLGYWMYDLAVAVAHCVGITEYARFRDALLAGYARYRSLPDAQLGQWDLFTAAFYVYYILWMVGVSHLHPGCLDEDTEDVMYRGAAFVLHYVQNRA